MYNGQLKVPNQCITVPVATAFFLVNCLLNLTSLMLTRLNVSMILHQSCMLQVSHMTSISYYMCIYRLVGVAAYCAYSFSFTSCIGIYRLVGVAAYCAYSFSFTSCIGIYRLVGVAAYCAYSFSFTSCIVCLFEKYFHPPIHNAMKDNSILCNNKYRDEIK